MKVCQVLPPLVNGKLAGHLSISVDEVFWVKPRQGDVIVHLTWWGQKEPVIFRPQDVSQKLSKRESSVLFEIRTSMALFESYLRNCERLVFKIYTCESHTFLGETVVKDLDHLMVEKSIVSYFPIFSESKARIGDLHIGFHLMFKRDLKISEKRGCEERSAQGKLPLKGILVEKSKPPLLTPSETNFKISDRLLSEVVEDGEELRRKMVMSVLQDTPSDQLEALIGQTYKPTNNQSNLIDYLLGKEMTEVEKGNAMKELRSASPIESIINQVSAERNTQTQPTSSAGDSGSRSESRRGEEKPGSKPNSSVESEGTSQPQNTETAEKDEGEEESEPELVDDCFRLTIESLKLTSLGIRKINYGLMPDKHLLPPGMSFTVELPEMNLNKPIKPKPSKHSAKSYGKSSVIKFGTSRVEKLSGGVTWWKVSSMLSGSLVKVTWRGLNQRVSCPLGHVVLPERLEPRGPSQSSLRLQLPVLTNTGHTAAHIVLHAQLGRAGIFEKLVFHQEKEEFPIAERANARSNTAAAVRRDKEGNVKSSWKENERPREGRPDEGTEGECLNVKTYGSSRETTTGGRRRVCKFGGWTVEKGRTEDPNQSENKLQIDGDVRLKSRSEDRLPYQSETRPLTCQDGEPLQLTGTNNRLCSKDRLLSPGEARQTAQSEERPRNTSENRLHIHGGARLITRSEDRLPCQSESRPPTREDRLLTLREPGQLTRNDNRLPYRRHLTQSEEKLQSNDRPPHQNDDRQLAQAKDKLLLSSESGLSNPSSDRFLSGVKYGPQNLDPPRRGERSNEDRPREGSQYKASTRGEGKASEVDNKRAEKCNGDERMNPMSHELTISVDRVHGFPLFSTQHHHDMDAYVEYTFPNLENKYITDRVVTEVSCIANNEVVWSKVKVHVGQVKCGLSQILAEHKDPSITFTLWGRLYQAQSLPRDFRLATAELPVGKLFSMEAEFNERREKSSVRRRVELPLEIVPSPINKEFEGYRGGAGSGVLSLSLTYRNFTEYRQPIPSLLSPIGEISERSIDPLQMKYDLGMEEKSFLTSEKLDPLSPEKELHHRPPVSKHYSWDSNRTFKSSDTNYSESSRPPFNFDVRTVPSKYNDHYLSERNYEENYMRSRAKSRGEMKPRYEDYYPKGEDKSYRRYEDLQRREEKNPLRMRYEENYWSDSAKERFVPRDIPEYHHKERRIRYDEPKGTHVPMAKEGRPSRYPLAGTSHHEYHGRGLEREYPKGYHHTSESHRDPDKYSAYDKHTRREDSGPIYETVPGPMADLNLDDTHRYPEEKLVDWTPALSDTSSDHRTKPSSHPPVARKSFSDNMIDIVDLESSPLRSQKDIPPTTSRSEGVDKLLRRTPEGEKRVGLDLLMEKFEEGLRIREVTDDGNDEAPELLHRTTQTSPQHQPSPSKDTSEEVDVENKGRATVSEIPEEIGDHAKRKETQNSGRRKEEDLELWKARVEVERAFNLPEGRGGPDGHQEGPTTFVTFTAYLDNVETKLSSHVVHNDSNPVWDASWEVQLPVKLLLKCDSRLRFVVQSVEDAARKKGPGRGGDAKELSEVYPIGRVPECVSDVDLTPLGAGLPNILGWFHLGNFSRHCGQIKIAVTPLEDISKYKERWVKEYSARRKATCGLLVDGEDPSCIGNLYVSKGVYRGGPPPPGGTAPDGGHLLLYSQLSRLSLPPGAPPQTSTDTDLTTSMLALSLKEKLSELGKLTEGLKRKVGELDQDRVSKLLGEHADNTSVQQQSTELIDLRFLDNEEDRRRSSLMEGRSRSEDEGKLFDSELTQIHTLSEDTLTLLASIQHSPQQQEGEEENGRRGSEGRLEGHTIVEDEKRNSIERASEELELLVKAFKLKLQDLNI